MDIDAVQRILIVGAGTMGREIGFQFARFGYDVVLYDADSAVLSRVLDELRRQLASFVDQGILQQAEVVAALGRMKTEDDLVTAAADVDLVSESVPEDPQLKRHVFAQLHQLCPSRTIFTTNSSTLLPSQIADAVGRPAQFAAFHFHTPVWVANVVDVMPHPGTTAETLALLQALGESIGQIPIVLEKEHHGYIFNAMLNALLTEAQTMAANGIAEPVHIDRAWMGVMKSGMGPFGIMDLIGLDTVWKITDYWAGQLPSNPQLRRNADFLYEYVQQGRLGRKSGRGFYTYPDPRYLQPGFLQPHGSSQQNGEPEADG